MWFGDMSDFLRLMGVNFNWQSYLPFANDDLGTTPLLIVLVMCIIGMTIINSVLKYTSFVNSVINFTGLFGAAYFANTLGKAWQIPDIDGTIMIAVLANAGMCVMAVILLIFHRNSMS